MASPVKVTLRAYNVGFGDCLLLIFAYGPKDERFVLVDFGSRELPDGAKSRMLEIAKDIEQRVNVNNRGLDAVVLTHRHLDHNSGFSGKPFEHIKACKPKIVVQPWTEEPGLDPKAKSPRGARRAAGFHAAAVRYAGTLAAMNDSAKSIRTEAMALRRGADHATLRTLDDIEFLGLDNVKNVAAVKNLANLGGKKGSLYLHYGASVKRLADLLPGVSIDVLGPPTPQQYPDVETATGSDPEFWKLTAAARAQAAVAARGDRIFPRARTVTPGPLERWTVHHVNRAQADALRGIVSVVDNAMNNTSLILLFRIGDTGLLFPGDAQIENWEYALKHAPDHAANLLKLAKVKLFKVGHHGSRNATPHSLWDLFKARKDKQGKSKPLSSVLSTKVGVYPGTPGKNTEVPRMTLVAELKKNSNLERTDHGTGSQLYVESSIDLT